MRDVSEFIEKAKTRETFKWKIHHCSICNYHCGFLFFNHSDYDVLYDAGCHCAWTFYFPRSWDAVAEHYNFQTDPEVIKIMDEFWGFDKDNKITEMQDE